MDTTYEAWKLLKKAGLSATPGRVERLVDLINGSLSPAERKRLRIMTSARGPAGNRYQFGKVPTRAGQCRPIGMHGDNRIIWAIWTKEGN